VVTRIHLAAVDGVFTIPPSCPACGDDLDIHEWVDVVGGTGSGVEMIAGCDRSGPADPAGPAAETRARLVATLVPS
jgi:hypothetical protein